MTTTQIIQTGEWQVVRLPQGFEFAAKEVAIRREGNAVILEPIKTGTWPEKFFERIHIADPAFRRPEQGAMPAAPKLDS
jgi:virulence-associated protein VagC